MWWQKNKAEICGRNCRPTSDEAEGEVGEIWREEDKLPFWTVKRARNQGMQIAASLWGRIESDTTEAT